MELLIFSDSHGRHDGMQEAIDRQLTGIDAVLFLGDGLRDADRLLCDGATLYSVRGNCDWFADASVEAEITLSFEGHRLLLTHGHLYGVKGGVGALISHAASLNADVVLFGHTHIPYCEVIPAGTVAGGRELTRPMYLFNPGSIGTDASFGTLSLKNDVVLLSHGSVKKGPF